MAQGRSAYTPPASHMTHTGTAEQNIKHSHAHMREHRACTKWRCQNNRFRLCCTDLHELSDPNRGQQLMFQIKEREDEL